MDAIHPAPIEFSAEQLTTDPILRYFHYSHLPAQLQTVSREFCGLADFIVQVLPRNAERTVALRKLLEAKDAGVRANVGAPAPLKPDTFFSRLVAERDETAGRLDKLDTFILSPGFAALDQDNRTLLQRQALQMRGYVDTLDARIKLIGGDVPPGINSVTGKVEPDKEDIAADDIEIRAERIFNVMPGKPSDVRWHRGGNSEKQEEARKLAREERARTAPEPDEDGVIDVRTTGGGSVETPIPFSD